MSEADVVAHLHVLHPRVDPEALGWILWNWTCFPFPGDGDSLTHWVRQVEQFLRERPDLKEEADG